MVIKHAEVMDNRVAVVDIEGPLDSYTSPDFEDYVNLLLEKNIVFILFDAARMEYVSSEGIGLLLFLQKKISEANGFFVIFNLQDEIQALYSLLGFDKIFRIVPSRAEALQMMDRQIELRDSGFSDEGDAGEPEEPAVEIAVPPAPEAAPRAQPPEAAPVAAEEPAPRSKVVACSTCRSQVRVDHDGDYLCPHCGTEFTVTGMDPASRPATATGEGFGPLIVECAQCKGLIRVKKPGAYRCADCGAKFTVSPDLAVKF
ncbi:MAG: STAS domain-containing protein [Spirochaetes bacterium]|nr:STAS domain-containing protein [Spirochaetota bacterium]